MIDCELVWGTIWVIFLGYHHLKGASRKLTSSPFLVLSIFVSSASGKAYYN